MKVEYKARLEENRLYLEEYLQVDEVLDLCIPKLMFGPCDVERIRAERARPDKVLKFIDILKCCPEDRCFEDFLQTLDHERVKQGFIRERLSQPSVSGQLQTDSEQEQLLEQIFREMFIMKEGEVTLPDPMLRVIRMKLRQVNKSLQGSDGKVFELLRKLFPGVKVKKNRKNRVVRIQNLSLRNETLQPFNTSVQDYFLKMNIKSKIIANSSSGDGPEVSLLKKNYSNRFEFEHESGHKVRSRAYGEASGGIEIPIPIPLDTISPESIANALRTELQIQNIDVKMVDRIEKEEIDGTALSQMDDDHIAKLFPELNTMGKRLKMLGLMRQTLEALQKPLEFKQTSVKTNRKLESFREFDVAPRPKDIYEKGYVLPEEQSRPGSLLQVVHKYCLMKDNDWNQFAKETVKFAAACMNERMNGTIHFGVASKYETAHQFQPGEIIGMHLDTLQCESTLTEEIYQVFFRDQRDIALKCIRNPVYIPVAAKELDDAHLYVVEVDIVPHCDIIMNQAIFLNAATGNRSVLLRYLNGAPTEVTGDELFMFMNFKNNLTDLRKEAELLKHSTSIEKPDLHRKLHSLLTDGNDFENIDIYPLLFLSPCSESMNREYLAENFKCIKSLEPLAVFDFDPSMQSSDGTSMGLQSIMEIELGQVYKALTTDNFDKNSEENKSSDTKDSVSRLLESICMSSFKSWIFCNGYEPLGKKELKPPAWRSCYGNGFKEAVRFYSEQIPTDKARILIFLLSRNYDVLLGALEEIFVKFPDQWIIVAESDKVAQHLISEVLRRGYVEKQVLEDRCVVGMPWSHINHSLMNIFGFTSGTGCTLPTTTGSPCMMKEREKNALCDLEILSMTQCTDEDIIQNGRIEDIENLKQKTEEDFYKGQQVSWWNFWFKDHVLRRAQFQKLLEMVNETLVSVHIPEDEKVAVITVLHQPGAGGTTTAREILWEKKSQVRCCVVKKITDQTCDQIARFRSFEETDCPKPPLVLIDNEDDEKVFQLCSYLNEKARREARDSKDTKRIFCVLIICIRMTAFPQNKNKKYKIMLGHELQTEEVQWFRTKYGILEERYNQGLTKENQGKQGLGLHPRLLISFNILKENFDLNYIKRTVDEFVNEIHDFREKRLLKYVALINSFQLDFESIPISCFNVIMCPPSAVKDTKPRLGQKTFSKGEIHWEASLSQSLNVLLNRTSKPCLGSVTKTIRIIHNKLSREILYNLCEREQQLTSDVILEFLHSDIFRKSYESSVQSQLIKIAKDMLKKRARHKQGKEKFSPLIMAIGEGTEGYEKAAEVLIVGFELLDDPMIAQQISRVYIHIQNWKEADKYAKIAQDMKPKNSYLCDTHGQVYKEKLIKMWKDCLDSEEQLEGEKAMEMIDVAFKAIEIFRREQKLNDEDCSTGYNNCGFFSELRVVVTLLDLCRFLKVFKYDKGKLLHNFLVSKDDIPKGLEELGKERIEMLKRLSEEYERPMRRLEDEHIQLKEDSCYQYSPSYTNTISDRRMFVHLQECLDVYFGEDSDKVPAHLKPHDACEFRRRRVKRRGGNSLRSIYDLRDEPKAAQEYQEMHCLIEKNVNSPFCNAFDLKTILNLTLARISLDKSKTFGISMVNILDWTQKLYDKTKTDVVPHLEAFLYLTMFHWPTEWRIKQGLPLCPCNKIKEVIKEWKAAFQNNHPAQKEAEGKLPDRRKGTTLFFLGQGEGLDEIVFYNELHRLFNRRLGDGDKMWDTELAKRQFRRLKGTLLHGGGEMSVTIYSPKGTPTDLLIPTSFPIKDQSLWQKKVHFVLGFCWSGPKAYSVTNDDKFDLESVSAPMPSAMPKRNYDRSQQKQMSMEVVAEFWQRYFKNQADLEIVKKDIHLCNSKAQRQLLLKKKEKLEKERECLVQKRTSVISGPE